jgi:hypothetical protein
VRGLGRAGRARPNLRVRARVGQDATLVFAPSRFPSRARLLASLPSAQFINHFGENYKQHDFGDPELLAKWSQLPDYRCVRNEKPVGPPPSSSPPPHHLIPVLPPSHRPLLPPRRYSSVLTHKQPEERDFPEARERLRQKGLL